MKQSAPCKQQKSTRRRRYTPSSSNQSDAFVWRIFAGFNRAEQLTVDVNPIGVRGPGRHEDRRVCKVTPTINGVFQYELFACGATRVTEPDLTRRCTRGHPCAATGIRKAGLQTGSLLHPRTHSNAVRQSALRCAMSLPGHHSGMRCEYAGSSRVVAMASA